MVLGWLCFVRKTQLVRAEPCFAYKNTAALFAEIRHGSGAGGGPSYLKTTDQQPRQRFVQYNVCIAVNAGDVVCPSGGLIGGLNQGGGAVPSPARSSFAGCGNGELAGEIGILRSSRQEVGIRKIR